jgi:hypothetical protein
MMTKANMVAHFNGPNKNNKGGMSDKVYIVCVYEDMKGNWIAQGRWGRNGTMNLSQKILGTKRTQDEARECAETQMLKKFRDGYVNIESSTYGGDLTLSTPFIAANMVEEDGAVTGVQKSVSVSAGNDIQVPAGQCLQLKVLKAYDEAGVSYVPGEIVSFDGPRMYESCERFEVISMELAKDGLDGAEVECLDNTGMEINFVQGSTYIVAESHAGKMFKVYDRLGEPFMCLKERFKEVVS